jgi:hypothetical protein
MNLSLHICSQRNFSLPNNSCSTAIPTCIEFLKMIETIKLMSVPHSQNICHNGPSITLSKSLLDPLDINNFSVTILKQNIRQWDWQLTPQAINQPFTFVYLVVARLLNTVRSELMTLLPRNVLSGLCRSYDCAPSYCRRIQMFPACMSGNF